MNKCLSSTTRPYGALPVCNASYRAISAENHRYGYSWCYWWSTPPRIYHVVTVLIHRNHWKAAVWLDLYSTSKTCSYSVRVFRIAVDIKMTINSFKRDLTDSFIFGQGIIWFSFICGTLIYGPLRVHRIANTTNDLIWFTVVCKLFGRCSPITIQQNIIISTNSDNYIRIDGMEKN